MSSARRQALLATVPHSAAAAACHRSYASSVIRAALRHSPRPCKGVECHQVLSKWQTSASALIIFCQSFGRPGILRSLPYRGRRYLAPFGALSTSRAARRAKHPIDAGPSNTQLSGDFRGPDAQLFEPDDLGSLSPNGRHTALVAAFSLWLGRSRRAAAPAWLPVRPAPPRR